MEFEQHRSVRISFRCGCARRVGVGGPNQSKVGEPCIRIAILDDGVDTTHADLAANIIPGYDFYDLDADPRPAPVTDLLDNHGTAVAGIAAAVINYGPAT